jgi:hypothetical protein
LDVQSNLGRYYSLALSHREFLDLLSNLETEFKALFITLKSNSAAAEKCQNKCSILKTKYKHSDRQGKTVAKFNNDEWMCEFACLVDITTYLKELNTYLKGLDQLINSTFVTSMPSK